MKTNSLHRKVFRWWILPLLFIEIIRCCMHSIKHIVDQSKTTYRNLIKGRPRAPSCKVCCFFLALYHHIVLCARALKKGPCINGPKNLIESKFLTKQDAYFILGDIIFLLCFFHSQLLLDNFSLFWEACCRLCKLSLSQRRPFGGQDIVCIHIQVISL